MIRLPQRKLSSQSLGKHSQLNQNNQKTEHIPQYQLKLIIHKNSPNKQQYNVKTILSLKQRQTEPGLVAFYNIWPENGAGLLLQPQTLHAPHGLSFTTFITILQWLSTADM